MKQNVIVFIATIFLCNLSAFGQKGLDKLRNHANFEWVTDTLEMNMTLYYEKNSYAEKNRERLKERVSRHLINTLGFVGVESYDNPIHYFIVEDRGRMEILLGRTINGNADPKNNYVTGIFSETIKSVYSNHELFHLISMNVWGYPKTWINEGMAVYSDNAWNGRDLYELSKYFVENDKYVSIGKLAKRLRKYDSMVAYPLLGGFVKFIDDTYGRETIKLIWTKGRKSLKRHIGKSLYDLEQEWLFMLNAMTDKDTNSTK